MLSEPVLIDTGPLLALYSEQDQYHQACVKQMSLLPVGKAYTCWPVITEAAYMLRHQATQRDDLFQSIINGDIIVLSLLERELKQVCQVFRTYHDQQVDFADACLLHLANREGIEVVFTLDRRHFSVFRNGASQPLRLLPDMI